MRSLAEQSSDLFSSQQSQKQLSWSKGMSKKCFVLWPTITVEREDAQGVSQKGLLLELNIISSVEWARQMFGRPQFYHLGSFRSHSVLPSKKIKDKLASETAWKGHHSSCHFFSTLIFLVNDSTWASVEFSLFIIFKVCLLLVSAEMKQPFYQKWAHTNGFSRTYP